GVAGCVYDWRGELRGAGGFDPANRDGGVIFGVLRKKDLRRRTRSFGTQRSQRDIVAAEEQLTCGAIDEGLRRAGTWKHGHSGFQITATLWTSCPEDEVEGAGTRARRA